jgi:hypothetical protein
MGMPLVAVVVVVVISGICPTTWGLWLLVVGRQNLADFENPTLPV